MNNLNPVSGVAPKSQMEQMTDLVNRSHESQQDYKNLQFLINQSQLSLGEKVTLLKLLDKKFSH
nr:hypothetical protein [Butyricicoccus sp. OF30-11pH9A]